MWFFPSDNIAIAFSLILLIGILLCWSRSRLESVVGKYPSGISLATDSHLAAAVEFRGEIDDLLAVRDKVPGSLLV